MELRFLGGTAEIGRSALLVNETVLVDFGMRPSTPPGWPIETPTPAAVVLSHGHLDHVGAVPSLCVGREMPPVYATPPTLACLRLLATDTLGLHGGTPRCPFTRHDLETALAASEAVGYEESVTVAGHEITLYNAGHIPGSAHVLVDDGETRLLYTGDLHTGEQRLVAPSTARPPADVVVIESTYADESHPRRAAVEAAFVSFVEETRWQGGTVLVPTFAVGRTQELLLVCAAHDIDAYVDGMGTRLFDDFDRHPTYLRDHDAYRRAISRARVVTGRNGQRRRIANDGAVVVSTSGMLAGGPALTYLECIRGDPTNAVALTGFQVPGTAGAELLARGACPINGTVRPVSARVEQFSFSAHADGDGLRSFLTAYPAAETFVVHGDDPVSAADTLSGCSRRTRVPELGESIIVGPS